MTLFATLRGAALSSLALSEAVRLGSQNVNNAENPNYHRHEVDFSTTDLNSVRISRVRRVTAEGLERRYATQISEAAYRATLQRYSEEIKISAGLGGVTSASGDVEAPILDLALSRFESALRDWQASPESSSAYNEFVASGRDFASQVQATAVDLQRLRYSIDNQIGQQIVELNRLTDRLRVLNGQVARTINTGNQEGLINQREEVVRQIAEKISVQIVEDERGRKNLYLQNGQSLVYESISHELNFDRGTRALSLDIDTNVIGDEEGHRLGNGSITALLDLARAGASSVADTDEDVALIAKYETQLENLARAFISGSTRGTPLADQSTSLNDTYHKSRIEQLTRTGIALVDTDNLARRDLFSANTARVNNPVRFAINFSSDLIAGTPDVQLGVTINLVEAVQTTNASHNILSALNSTTRQIPPILAANSNITALGLPVTATLPPALQQENQSYYGLVQGISVRLSGITVAYGDRSVQQSGTRDDLQTLLSNFVGVNIDEEFLKINQLQQTYAANARVINSVQEMLDDLLRTV